MELAEQDIKQLLQESLSLAQAEPDRGRSAQEIHQNRSRSWVTILAKQFHNIYQDEPEVHVFSKYDNSHRKEFGLNELLYDILVCKVGKVPAARNKKTILSFVKETIWQVESEFALSSRQALIDFNKLVLGSAHNKLFIGPQVSKTEPYIDILKPAAGACTGSVYVALIPHPAKWKDTTGNVRLWSLKR